MDSVAQLLEGSDLVLVDCLISQESSVAQLL